jgi:hypothetical protein
MGLRHAAVAIRKEKSPKTAGYCSEVRNDPAVFSFMEFGTQSRRLLRG